MGKVHFEGSECLRRGSYTQTKHKLKSTSNPHLVTCAFCHAFLSLDGQDSEYFTKSDDQHLYESIQFSSKFEFNKEGEPVFTFGKHKGELCKNNPDFLRWIERTATFDQKDRSIAEMLLKKIL